jgi:hypothetical protein
MMIANIGKIYGTAKRWRKFLAFRALKRRGTQRCNAKLATQNHKTGDAATQNWRRKTIKLAPQHRKWYL